MVYRYDGSFAGLLSVLARIFCWEESPGAIVAGDAPQEDLFAPSALEIPTAPLRAARMLSAVEKRMGRRAARRLLLAHASEAPEAPMAIYHYLALGRRSGRGIESHLTDPSVRTVHGLAARVGREAHRFKGLVRFRELADGVLYAPLRPDFAILPLLAPHFSRRLGDSRWILHDLNRQWGIAGEGGDWQDGSLEREGPLPAAEDEERFQGLWRRFFAEIAIPERTSRRRQMQFMPRKYWEHLVEMNSAP